MSKKILGALISGYLHVASYLNRNRKPKEIVDKFSLSMNEFGRLINGMDYKADKLGGLLDNVAEPDTFFDDKKSDRDCDDWARMWSWWLTYNGYKATEYCVTNPTSLKTLFRTMHMVTVGEKDGKYWLMNYWSYGPFDSEGEALVQLLRWKSYEDNILVVKSPAKFRIDE